MQQIGQDIVLALLAVVLFFVGFILTHALEYAFREKRQFKQMDGNPYRRVCRTCGQIRHQYCWSWSWSTSWWEDMSPVPDQECECHKYSEYRTI